MMNQFSIQAASQISGISDACIRIWEKRYNCITPTRTASNHRVYSDKDIERLTVLYKLTSFGMKISQLSILPTEELKKILNSMGHAEFNKIESAEFETSTDLAKSLFIIEESFTAHRFDVAYHELEKAMATNSLKNLALEFFPNLETICRTYKNKSLTFAEHIYAFERFSNTLASQKAHSNKLKGTGIKSLSISLAANLNRLNHSSLEMLLASYRIDDCHFNNETSFDFIIASEMAINPNYIFIVADIENRDLTNLLEKLEANSKAKIIVYDAQQTRFGNKSDLKDKKIQSFNNIQGINSYLKSSLQS